MRSKVSTARSNRWLAIAAIRGRNRSTVCGVNARVTSPAEARMVRWVLEEHAGRCRLSTRTLVACKVGWRGLAETTVCERHLHVGVPCQPDIAGRRQLHGLICAQSCVEWVRFLEKIRSAGVEGSKCH